MGHRGDDSAGVVRGDLSALEMLLERLLARRARVRELIVGFGESARRPFPNWGEGEGKVVRERWRKQNGCKIVSRIREWCEAGKGEAWRNASSASSNSSVMCRIR